MNVEKGTKLLTKYYLQGSVRFKIPFSFAMIIIY